MRYVRQLHVGSVPLATVPRQSLGCTGAKAHGLEAVLNEALFLMPSIISGVLALKRTSITCLLSRKRLPCPPGCRPLPEGQRTAFLFASRPCKCYMKEPQAARKLTEMPVQQRKGRMGENLDMGTDRTRNITPEQVLACAIDIGEQLLINGAEAWRVEDTIRRLSKAYGMKQVHVFSMTSMIMATVETPDGHWESQSRRVLRYGIDMTRLDALNSLSRSICREQYDYATVREKFDAVRAGKRYSWPVQCLVGALIGASFTVFFGGSLRDACAACLVGAIIRALVFLLDRPQIMPMFSNTLTSFLAGTP